MVIKLPLIDQRHIQRQTTPTTTTTRFIKTTSSTKKRLRRRPTTTTIRRKRTTTSYNVSCSLTRVNRSGSTAYLGTASVECQLRGTSIEAKYNKIEVKYNMHIYPYIGRGQVQHAHRPLHRRRSSTTSASTKHIDRGQVHQVHRED